MLYELIAIVRTGNLKEVKEYVFNASDHPEPFAAIPNPTPSWIKTDKKQHNRIATTVGSTILRNGGVIRGLDNWGVFSLPKPVSVHQVKHHHGHYFVMRYDASAKLHSEVRSLMRLEPRMIRAGHVKLGDGKLDTLSRFGAPKWRTEGSEA